MSLRREQRLSELLKMTISEILLQMKDPRLSLLTITRVELTKDLRGARVFFSALGEEAQQRTAQRGLEHARGRLQAEIHHQLDLRYTPVLTFIHDPAIAKSFRISQLLKEALKDSGPVTADPDKEKKAESESEPPTGSEEQGRKGL